MLAESNQKSDVDMEKNILF